MVICFVGIFLAVLIFSGVIPSSGSKQDKELQGDIVIWGVVPEAAVVPIIDALGKSAQTYAVTYKQKSKEDFETSFIEALASGKAPDLVFIDESMIIRHADKLLPIPYESLSQRDFKNTYTEGSELFMSAAGTIAIPLVVDPMLMYYNRDLLSDAGIASPPVYWNEFVDLAPQLAKIDESGKLTKNMIAFGEFDNVTHAKDIVSLLFMQLGNPIVSRGLEPAGETQIVVYKGTLDQANNEGLPVAQSALRFYTQFSDPVKKSYSWNKTFPSSRNMFIAGKLPFYFGYASEYRTIQEKNPHLNFDIIRVPQVKDYPTKTTIGGTTALAIVKATNNQATAYNTLSFFSSKESTAALATMFGVAPARRDLLSQKQTDTFNAVVYPSALIAKQWLDPSKEGTDLLFREMITGLVSGKLNISEAIDNAKTDLDKLLRTQ